MSRKAEAEEGIQAAEWWEKNAVQSCMQDQWKAACMPRAIILRDLYNSLRVTVRVKCCRDISLADLLTVCLGVCSLPPHSDKTFPLCNLERELK